MSDILLLEDGVDDYLLEDGSGVLLLEQATVSYSDLIATQDSTSDTDHEYVYGSTPEGSGFVSNGTPRTPPRYSSVDASASTSAKTTQQVGLAQLSLVQGVNRVQLTVTGYDGWAKGQSLFVTNAQMGWHMVQFWIAGVSMKTLSGTGYREYTLQLNASLPRLSRIIAANNNSGPTLGAAIQGQIGGY